MLKALAVIITSLVMAIRSLLFPSAGEIKSPKVEWKETSPTETEPSPSPARQIITQVTQTPKILKPTVGLPKPTAVLEDNSPWGVARQVSEHTWTMKIGEDPAMATPKEVLNALNEYRRTHGKSQLTWDDKLAQYGQTRASYFVEIKRLDEHKGFIDYLENQDGFNKLGFNSLGENSSYGYQLSGVHLIEWIFAGDKPHDDNQLNNDWAYAGVGVKGTSVAIIFGTGKM